MGGGKTTSTTTVTQTAEEKEYTKQQIELAKQQLKLVEEQHGWQSEIYTLTKPLLEKYALMVDQDFAEYNSPEVAALRAKQRELDTAQVDSAIRQLPVQEELMQLQLDEIRRGGRATPEQKALIDQIAARALESGEADIGRFMSTGMNQLRENVAPARGMRPDDGPMVEANQKVLEEALRQQGGLVSDIRGAAANAELNFPLNASQITGGFNQWQQGFNQNMNQFLSQLNQKATQNRSQLMGQLFSAPMSSSELGLGLIDRTRPNAVNFPRNTTTTEKTSGGSILGGIGGLLSGIGSVGSLFSSKKAKTNIKPLQAPPGHLLSPGALKTGFKPMTVGGTSPRPVSLNFDPQITGGPDVSAVKKPTNWDTPVWDPPLPPQQSDFTAKNPDWSKPIVDPPAPPQSGDDLLDRLATLPLSTWQYKPETGLGGPTHVGPMAEDFNTKVMGKGPEPFINTVDAVGSLMASVQALDKRTRGLGLTKRKPKQKQPAMAGAGGSTWPRG